MRRTVILAIVAAAWLAGCEPKQKDIAWQNPLEVMERSVPADPKNSAYILGRMEFGKTALSSGCYLRAQPKLKEAFDQLEGEHANVAAALSSEKYKYYKGETYERAMLCWYLGYIEYLRGDYNNARIYFQRSLTEDRKAVVKKDTPEVVGDDFGLTYYWLGRTYLKLGQADNARIAFAKAAVSAPRKQAAEEQAADRKQAEKHQKDRIEAETWCSQTFGDPKKTDLYTPGLVNLAAVNGAFEAAADRQPFAPDQPSPAQACESREKFFSPDGQKAANLVLTFEVGPCPHKYLGGIDKEKTEIGRPTIRPSRIRVYVDGHSAGEAFKVLDLWDQAATQDRVTEKEAAQVAKALAKTALKNLVGVGDEWDVSGDVRYWTALPGRVYLYAAQVGPGTHTVRIEMYDANGKLLPRWTNTYHGLRVPTHGEAAMLLDPRYDGDNQLSPAQLAKAAKAGAAAVEK